MDSNNIDIKEIKDILKIFTNFLKHLGLYELFRYYTTHEDKTMPYEKKIYYLKRTLKFDPQSVFSNVLSSFCWTITKEPYTWVVVSKYWEILILLRNGSEPQTIKTNIDDMLYYINKHSYLFRGNENNTLKIIKDEAFKLIKTLPSNS